MRLAILLAMTALLAGCGRSNIAEQGDDYAGTGEISAPQAPSKPAPASRTSKEPWVPATPEPDDMGPITAPPPPAPVAPKEQARFIVPDEGGTAPGGLTMTVIRDLGTGCEYVVTGLFGEDMTAEPRMEPTEADQEVHRCVTSKGRGYVWIGGSLPAQITTVRDTQTGCEYILGTMYGQTAFMIRRMMRSTGTDTRMVCRART